MFIDQRCQILTFVGTNHQPITMPTEPLLNNHTPCLWRLEDSFKSHHTREQRVQHLTCRPVRGKGAITAVDALLSQCIGGVAWPPMFINALMTTCSDRAWGRGYVLESTWVAMCYIPDWYYDKHDSLLWQETTRRRQQLVLKFLINNMQLWNLSKWDLAKCFSLQNKSTKVHNTRVQASSQD